MAETAADVLIDTIHEGCRRGLRHARRRHQRDHGGAAHAACALPYAIDLQPIDVAAFARDCGAAGFTIADPCDRGRVLDEALATPGPVVVEAVVDPFEPPLRHGA